MEEGGGGTRHKTNKLGEKEAKIDSELSGGENDDVHTKHLI